MTQIEARHPRGFLVRLDVQSLHDVDPMLETLLRQGYQPTAHEWPRTPEGLPLCPRHGTCMHTRANPSTYSPD